MIFPYDLCYLKKIIKDDTIYKLQTVLKIFCLKKIQKPWNNHIYKILIFIKLRRSEQFLIILYLGSPTKMKMVHHEL